MSESNSAGGVPLPEIWLNSGRVGTPCGHLNGKYKANGFVSLQGDIPFAIAIGLSPIAPRKLSRK